MNRLAARGLLLLVACAVLMASGCGGAPLPPAQQAVEQARSGIDGAVVAGSAAVSAAAPYTLRARYNPVESTRCALCPPFEVEFRGSWQRVFLATSDDVLLSLEGAVDGVEVPAFYRFVGTPTDEVQRVGEDGQLFGVFELDSFSVSEP